MLNISKHYAGQIISHAKQESPNECCGILAGHNGHVVKMFRVTNSEKSPYRYNMDSKELLKVYREIEDNGWDMLALYHSHTHTEAYPSQTDVRLATWPDTYYILVSLKNAMNPDIRAFLINGNDVAETQVNLT